MATTFQNWISAEVAMATVPAVEAQGLLRGELQQQCLQAGRRSSRRSSSGEGALRPNK